MTDDDAGIIHIESTRGGPGSEPCCKITGPGFTDYPPVSAVRLTAVDLVTCAAYAELMMTLIHDAHIPAHAVTGLVSDTIRASGRDSFGTPATISCLPAGSSKTPKPVVIVERGSHRGAVSASEARGMALGWLEAAEASESDHLVAAGLAHLGTPDRIAVDLFAWLARRRGDTATEPR
jgi:hypothetical protein